MINAEDEVEALLDRAYESEDPEEIESLVNRALELQPDNPEALLLRADLMDDDDERLNIVTRALDTAREIIRQEDIPDDELAEDEMGMIYLALLQRQAFLLFEAGDDDGALQAAEELIRCEVDDNGASKNLYYRILIEKNEWRRILRECDLDYDHQLGWAYARLAATFMLGQDADDRSAAAGMFWDALALSPNAPFYMLGYFPEPVDPDTGDEQEDFNFSILFSDVWPMSRDMLNWFSRGVILFGLLSARFGEDSENMLEILTSLNGLEEYERMSDIICDGDDSLIIETLAAHKCLA